MQVACNLEEQGWGRSKDSQKKVYYSENRIGPEVMEKLEKWFVSLTLMSYFLNSQWNDANIYTIGLFEN